MSLPIEADGEGVEHEISVCREARADKGIRRFTGSAIITILCNIVAPDASIFDVIGLGRRVGANIIRNRENCFEQSTADGS